MLAYVCEISLRRILLGVGVWLGSRQSGAVWIRLMGSELSVPLSIKFWNAYWNVTCRREEGGGCTFSKIMLLYWITRWDRAHPLTHFTYVHLYAKSHVVSKIMLFFYWITRWDRGLKNTLPDTLYLRMYVCTSVCKKSPPPPYIHKVTLSDIYHLMQSCLCVAKIIHRPSR